MNTNNFDLINYYEKLDKIIYGILSRHENEIVTFDILDTKKTIKNKLNILREKQRQMKIGEIWQEVLGNYDGFVNLRVGHMSGLDIISHTKKIAIELKNRTNTDNYSSKKYNINKLSVYKIAHPEYTCIYANINDTTKEKTMKGNKKIIYHNGVIIEQYIGYELLKFILGTNTRPIINFVRNTIDKYI